MYLRETLLLNGTAFDAFREVNMQGCGWNLGKHASGPLAYQGETQFDSSPITCRLQASASLPPLEAYGTSHL